MKTMNCCLQKSSLLMPIVLGFLIASGLGADAAPATDSDIDQGKEFSKTRKFAEAVECFTRAIEKNGQNDMAYLARGSAWAELGEYSKAINDYTAALKINPKDPGYYFRRAQAEQAAGSIDAAIADYGECIRLDPKNGQVYASRAGAYNDKGDFSKAIADAEQALQIEPRHPMGWMNRAFARKAMGNYGAAIADLEKVLLLDSKCAEAHNGLGWIYATCPLAEFRNGRKAFTNAKEAYLTTEGTVATCMDTLAAAYAELGDFQAACKWQTKAIEATIAKQDKEEGRARLELYKHEKPYREKKPETNAPAPAATPVQ